MKIKPFKPYIPYSGAKQKIAELIIQVIKSKHPHKTTFIDLFGGGGSMSLEALQQGYQKVVYNEYQRGYYILLKSLKARREYCIANSLPLTLPQHYYNFVGKQQYQDIRTTPDNLLNDEQLAYKYFVLSCYTFNNLQKKTSRGEGWASAYLYGRDKRDANYYIHQALVFKDKNALQQIKNYFGMLGDIVNIFECCLQNDLQKAIYDFNRYISIITFLFETINDKPNITPIINRLNEEYNKNKNYFDDNPQCNLCRLLLLYGIKPRTQKMSCGDLIKGGVFACDHLTRILHLQAILQLPLEKLELYNMGYANFAMTYNNSVVYCDPPYFNTLGYSDIDFDFSRFSGWCYNCKYPLFVSEITNPNPNKLQSVWVKEIRDNISNKKLRKEQLFWNGI